MVHTEIWDMNNKFKTKIALQITDSSTNRQAKVIGLSTGWQITSCYVGVRTERGYTKALACQRARWRATMREGRAMFPSLPCERGHPTACSHGVEVQRKRVCEEFRRREVAEERRRKCGCSGWHWTPANA